MVQEADFWTAPEDHLPRWSWGAGLVKSAPERSNVQCERKAYFQRKWASDVPRETCSTVHTVWIPRAKNWPAYLSCHSNKTTLTRGAVWAIKTARSVNARKPFLKTRSSGAVWSGLTKTTFKVSENGVLVWTSHKSPFLSWSSLYTNNFQVSNASLCKTILKRWILETSYIEWNVHGCLSNLWNFYLGPRLTKSWF